MMLFEVGQIVAAAREAEEVTQSDVLFTNQIRMPYHGQDLLG